MNQLNSVYLAIAALGVSYISAILTFVLNCLMEANRLKKIELKHRGISEKEIEGK
jgi:hypothetical protein